MENSTTRASADYVGYYSCSRGYYCPPGIGRDWKKCPPGTYSNELGLYQESQCIMCPSGKYCDGINSMQPSGDCSAGYYCSIGEHFCFMFYRLNVSLFFHV